MSVYPVYLYTIHFFSLSISFSTRSEAILPINVPLTEAAKLAQPNNPTHKIYIIPLRIMGPRFIKGGVFCGDFFKLIPKIITPTPL